MSLKRLPAGVERINCPRLQHLYLQLQNISTKATIFMDMKHERNKSGSYLNFFKYFLHFLLLGSNTKIQIGPMISFRILSALFLLKLKNQFGITFMTYSSKFLANIESF